MYKQTNNNTKDFFKRLIFNEYLLRVIQELVKTNAYVNANMFCIVYQINNLLFLKHRLLYCDSLSEFIQHITHELDLLLVQLGVGQSS